MKTKTFFILLAVFFLFGSFTYAQTDSVKTYKIKNTNMEIGKYYELLFHDTPSMKGKLIAVNKSTIIVLIDNEIEEIEIGDILGVQTVEADNIIYTSSKPRRYKPIYSISAGYTQRVADHNSNYSYNYNYYYNYDNEKYNGFNILGDALIKTSDLFGFRFDFNYLHIFGKKLADGYSYYNYYDSSYSRSETDYSDLNIFTVKTGICFGSMSRDVPINFYIYLGLGFGWQFKNADVYYNYHTKNNVTTVNESQYNSNSDFLFGAHSQIRFSYKISNKYMIFVEPSVQYWSADTDGLFGINGGITFIL